MRDHVHRPARVFWTLFITACLAGCRVAGLGGLPPVAECFDLLGDTIRYSAPRQIGPLVYVTPYWESVALRPLGGFCWSSELNPEWGAGAALLSMLRPEGDFPYDWNLELLLSAVGELDCAWELSPVELENCLLAGGLEGLGESVGIRYSTAVDFGDMVWISSDGRDNHLYQGVENVDLAAGALRQYLCPEAGLIRTLTMQAGGRALWADRSVFPP